MHAVGPPGETIIAVDQTKGSSATNWPRGDFCRLGIVFLAFHQVFSKQHHDLSDLADGARQDGTLPLTLS
jgi:hypothetical protein